MDSVRDGLQESVTFDSDIPIHPAVPECRCHSVGQDNVNTDEMASVEGHGGSLVLREPLDVHVNILECGILDHRFPEVTVPEF